MRTLVTLLIYTVVEACYIPSAFASHPIQALQPVNASAAEQTGTPLQGSLNLGDKVIDEIENRYVLHKEDDPIFYQVVEKLPAGGFGRLLRYRGQIGTSQWIDLEFVYQDEINRLTVLDYGSGRFYRITFHKKSKESFCLFPSEDGKGFNKDTCPLPGSSSKWVLASKNLPHWALPEIQRILVHAIGLTEEQRWNERLVRGPPAQEAAS